MLKSALVALAALILLTSPTLALPFCDEQSGSLFQFGVSTDDGPIFTEQERTDMYLMRLKRQGVDAVAADIWNGCIRATVRQGNGSLHFEFYQPSTLERIYLN